MRNNTERFEMTLYQWPQKRGWEYKLLSAQFYTGTKSNGEFGCAWVTKGRNKSYIIIGTVQYSRMWYHCPHMIVVGIHNSFESGCVFASE